MKNRLLKIKDFSFTFIYLNIYIILMIFIPKKFSSIHSIPIRLILTIGLFIVAFLDYRKGRISFQKRSVKNIIFIFVLFILATIPSLFLTRNLIVSIYTIIKYLSGFLLFVFFLKIDFTEKEYKLLLKNVLFCMVVILLLGIIFYLTGYNLMIKKSGINYYPGAKGRLNVTFFNTIYYGIFLDLVLPILIYKIYNSKKNINILFYIFVFALLYCNVLLTFTRSALIVFFGILFIIIVAFNKRLFKKRTIIIFSIILSFSFLLPGAKPLITKSTKDVYHMTSKVTNLLKFLPSSAESDDEYVDFDEDSDYQDYSLQHREAFARIANRVANDNRYTGVGFGAYIDYMNSDDFSIKYPDYTLSKTHPHSAMTLMYAEVGVIGLTFFCIFIINLLFISFNSIIRNAFKNEKAYILSVVSFCIICGFVIVNIVSENVIYDTQVGYLFYLIYACILGYVFKIENKKVMFISSTGGHFSELSQLKKLYDKYDYMIVTEKTKSTIGLKKQYGKRINYLAFGTKDHKFSYPFKFLYNCVKSLFIFLIFSPKVIVTTGTHTAVPMCYIGKFFGCKIIFIETFANSTSKTLSGRLVYPIADTFVVQWEGMLKLYPKAKYWGWIY